MGWNNPVNKFNVAYIDVLMLIIWLLIKSMPSGIKRKLCHKVLWPGVKHFVFSFRILTFDEQH
jgi:hypothetical protein